jgi:hypothetical protein
MTERLSISCAPVQAQVCPPGEQPAVDTVHGRQPALEGGTRTKARAKIL